MKMKKLFKASEKARQKRILKREANTVLVEFVIYYDTVPTSASFIPASPNASSWHETTTEFVRADGKRIVMSYYNYGETVALPEFVEIKAAIEKYLAFVKRIEKWVAENCNYIEMAVNSENMARRLVFTQKNKRVNKRSEFYYFDCRLTAQPFRGTASIESNGKFILTKPIEIRINKDNRDFSNEDVAYELAIKTMQDILENGIIFRFPVYRGCTRRSTRKLPLRGRRRRGRRTEKRFRSSV
jgi:hypothetical protein